MMPIGTGRFWRVARIILISIAALLFISLLLRNPLLSYFIHRKIDDFNRLYQARLTVEKTRIRWLSSLRITGLMLRPAEGDTLLLIDTLSARLSFFGLISGKIKLSDFELKNTHLSFVRRDSVTNYMFLLDRKIPKRASDPTIVLRDYSHSAAILLETVFNKIPDELLIEDFQVTSETDGHRIHLGVHRLQIEDHAFETLITVEEDTITSRWRFTGRLDRNERIADFMLVSEDSSPVRLPYLKYRWDGDIRFDTLAFSLYGHSDHDSLVTIAGEARLTDFSVNHPRLASREVSFGRMGIAYKVNIGSNYMELDSTTEVLFNKLRFHPFIRYHPQPSAQIIMMVHKPPFPAQDLFSSMPSGLFETLEGIQVSGELSYHFDFSVDLSEPDSLRFESELERHRFNIISYGDGTLLKMSEPFEYTAYERGVPVRTFMVGPENPDYRSLERISPYLRGAVITSEDGGFYEHRGFLMDAIRESIATNIKERRFARGGSTITMQLMKNVFLSRQKTLVRKIEEVLITWLLESQEVYTKDRMFEVYLNIIEWGPMIYGANEASRFYFHKDVSKLNLGEAIFLASVIPAPKWYKSSVDSTGHLMPHMDEYYKLVSEKMLKKGRITQEEFDGLEMPVMWREALEVGN